MRPSASEVASWAKDDYAEHAVPTHRLDALYAQSTSVHWIKSCWFGCLGDRGKQACPKKGRRPVSFIETTVFPYTQGILGVSLQGNSSGSLEANLTT